MPAFAATTTTTTLAKRALTLYLAHLLSKIIGSYLDGPAAVLL